jgi:hypothetical protein
LVGNPFKKWLGPFFPELLSGVVKGFGPLGIFGFNRDFWFLEIFEKIGECQDEWGEWLNGYKLA